MFAIVIDAMAKNEDKPAHQLMPEEFRWEIDWQELPEEAPQKPLVRPPADSLNTPVALPREAQSGAVSVASPAPIAVSQAPVAPLPLPTNRPAPPQVAAQPVIPVLEKISLVCGQRIDLAALGCGDFVFDIAVRLAAPGANLCCLGLLENDRFVGDNYFISKKQPAMPCGSGLLRANDTETVIHFELAQAPAALHRLVLAIYTDASHGFGTDGAGALQLRHGVALVAEYPFTANELGSSRCALIAEIYRRHSGWRLGLLLAGVAGSIKSLLRLHGADVL